MPSETSGRDKGEHTKIEVHVVDFKPDFFPEAPPICLHCTYPLDDDSFLGTLEPDMVRGDHVVILDLYQCVSCHNFVVVVYDLF